MKNLYNNLDKNEKNRILEMHKKATKNNYLSEQDFSDIFTSGMDMIEKGFNFFKGLSDQAIQMMVKDPKVQDCFKNNNVTFPSSCSNPTSEACRSELSNLLKQNQDLANCLMKIKNLPIMRGS